MAKKVNVTPQQFAQRWAQGIQGAGQRIEEGVNAVTTSPGAAAAAQADLWLRNIQNSKAKWTKNVQVPLEEWKQATIQKGIPALQNAVAMAQPKVEQQAGKIINTLNSLLGTIPARGATLEQNLQRVRHIAEGMQKAFSQ